MLLPYCDTVDSACVRSWSVGGLSVAIIVCTVFALRWICPIVVKSNKWYLINVVMLVLSLLQMILLTIQMLVYTIAPFMENYFRAMQIWISCVLYGKLAMDMLHRPKWFFTVLAPIMAIAMLIMTGNVLVMMRESYIDCHHVSWLVLSVVTCILSISSAVSGQVVMYHIQSKCANVKLMHSVGNERELEQTHEQLWILLLVNIGSATMQLGLDLYIKYAVVGWKTCDAMFFDKNSIWLEQLIRFNISFFVHIVPQVVTLYVFYWIPRHQFTTYLDIPAVSDSSDDDSVYQRMFS